MSHRWSTILRTPLRLLALAVLVEAAACSTLETSEEIANEARVVVSGDTPVPLELVTSTKFTRTTNQDGGTSISLAYSDTVSLDLATVHDQVYPVKPDRGFFLKLRNYDTLTANIDALQVYFDGELKYERKNLTLTQASVEFSYIFENYNILR